jgi:pimeloyl-ACP methyl ester carboxylesterase
MSCDIALSGAILFAALHPAPARPLVLAALADAPAPASAALNPLAREPLYAEIVQRAGRLKSEVDGYRKLTGAAALPRFDAFKGDVAALAALDLQGHLDLAKRGTDGDLKCILKGISMDLPRKLSEVEAAGDKGDARRTALDEMFYLLRDNVEVITSPPQPTV